MTKLFRRKINGKWREIPACDKSQANRIARNIATSNLKTVASITADPKPKSLPLDETESACGWFDEQEVRWSLRDEGRNPDGSGESYAERNA